MNRQRSLFMIALGFVFAVLFLISGDHQSASAQSISEGWQASFYGKITTQGSATDNRGVNPSFLTKYATVTTISFSPTNPAAGHPMSVVVHVSCTVKCSSMVSGSVTLLMATKAKSINLGTQLLSAGSTTYTVTPSATCYNFGAEYPGNQIQFLPSSTTKQICF